MPSTYERWIALLVFNADIHIHWRNLGVDAENMNKSQSCDEFSNCDDEIYSNVDYSQQARKVAARSSQDCSQSLKKKPMPLPKPQPSISTPLTSNRSNNSSASDHHPGFYTDDQNCRFNSTGKYSAYHEDEATYDEVGSAHCRSLPATVSTPQEALSLYEDAKEVRQQRLSLYPLQNHKKPKSAETLESKICEEVEPQYSEAIQVTKNKLGPLENGWQLYSDVDSAVQTGAQHMTMVPSDNGEDEDPIYDDVYIEKVPKKKRVASECPAKLPLTGRAQTIDDALRRKQKSTCIDPTYSGRQKQLCSKELGESNIYEEPMSVVNSRLQKSECTDSAPEAIYDEAAVVLASGLLPSERDEEPLYDEAVAVKTRCLGRPDLGKAGKALKQKNMEEEPKEPVYDEARPVVDAKLPLGEREVALRKSSAIVMRSKKEDPYQRAASVRGSFMEDSSDDDEPTYYNLLLVKMSLERCNRLFYAAFDHQFTMEKLESKARRLSKLWGDVPGLKIGMIPETRSPDFHQQLKAGTVLLVENLS